MQKIIIYLNKFLKISLLSFVSIFDVFFTFILFYSNGIIFSSFKSSGIPKINIALGGSCEIGKNFRLNNREISNPIGRFNKCSIIVGNKAKLVIGDNVGMSSTAIVCNNNIRIGDNVKIGGNVVIYDTDFHSLNFLKRLNPETDLTNTISAPVLIGNNVFIGAHTTILKGIHIGDNSVIGACSVVTKSIPSNEIWAGNPAKLIRVLKI